MQFLFVKIESISLRNTSLGDIRLDKAQERLVILHHSSEKDLLTFHSLRYHRLHGTKKYSIDANGRTSKWRITFAWANQELTDVSLVRIEDTHWFHETPHQPRRRSAPR